MDIKQVYSHKSHLKKMCWTVVQHSIKLFKTIMKKKKICRNDTGMPT